MQNIGQNLEEDFISNGEIVGYALTTLAVKPPFDKGPPKNIECPDDPDGHTVHGRVNFRFGSKIHGPIGLRY